VITEGKVIPSFYT